MAAIALKIAITTGDRDGIGLEVAEKALYKLGPQASAHFLIWRSAKSYPKNLNRLKSKFKLVSFQSAKDALAFLQSNQMKSKMLVEVVSEESPALWVETTARWCANKDIHGMVTGPISKTEIHAAGLKDMGHTDILKRVAQASQVHMGFLGDKFNVLLTTAHIPLEKVPESLTEESLRAGLLAANQLRQMLSAAQKKKPLGILGLNPHAGEEGLIGSQESKLFPSILKAAKDLKIPALGPLVPDAAFQKENWTKYSVYLAMYHDQGLIPFKLVHGQDNGVHISVGLPFIRTSVDHGTAKDIFAKNKAKSASMCDAIRTCLKLLKSSIN